MLKEELNRIQEMFNMKMQSMDMQSSEQVKQFQEYEFNVKQSIQKQVQDFNR